MSSATLVLGIGNILLGDEGVGVQAVRRLAASPTAAADAEFLDGGTLGLTLVGPIAAARCLVVIDAAEFGAPPGSMRLFCGKAMDDFLHAGKRTAHDIGFADALDATRLSGELPAQRAFIGVQPAQVAWSETLSPPVAQALDAVCTATIELLAAWRQ